MSQRPVKKQEVLKIDGDSEYTQEIAIYDHTGDGTDEDAVATVTVHHDGYLVGIDGTTFLAATANGDAAIVELSKSGNYQAFVNDNPDTLMVLAVVFHALTQGGANCAMRGEKRCKIFFRAGERIYLNLYGTNTKQVSATFTLHWRNL